MLVTKFFRTPNIAERERAILDPDLIETTQPRFAATLAGRHAAIGWRKNMELTTEMLRDFGANAPLDLARISDVEIPVCVAVGEPDAFVPVDECIALAKAFPRGSLEVLPETQHPFEGVPLQRLAFSIREWLHRDRGPSGDSIRTG